MELGLISFFDFQLNRANSFFYEALLIFEKVNYKLGIGKCLLRLSHVWAFLCRGRMGVIGRSERE
jgi:hypothetical protein